MSTKLSRNIERGHHPLYDGQHHLSILRDQQEGCHVCEPVERNRRGEDEERLACPVVVRAVDQLHEWSSKNHPADGQREHEREHELQRAVEHHPHRGVARRATVARRPGRRLCPRPSSGRRQPRTGGRPPRSCRPRSGVSNAREDRGVHTEENRPEDAGEPTGAAIRISGHRNPRSTSRRGGRPCRKTSTSASTSANSAPPR